MWAWSYALASADSSTFALLKASAEVAFADLDTSATTVLIGASNYL